MQSDLSIMLSEHFMALIPVIPPEFTVKRLRYIHYANVHYEYIRPNGAEPDAVF